MKKKKVYVHFEGNPDHTVVFRVPSKSGPDLITLADVIEEFTKAYNKKHGSIRSLVAGRLRVTSENKVLPRDRRLDDHAVPLEDLYVEEMERAAETPQIDTRSSYTIEQSSGKPSGVAGSNPKVVSRPDATDPVAAPALEEVLQSKNSRLSNVNLFTLKHALEKAEGHVGASNYRQALEEYAVALSIDPVNKVALYRTGIIFNDASRYIDAVSVLKKGVAAFPEEQEFVYRLGEAYEKLGRVQEALDLYDAASRLPAFQGSVEVVRTLRVHVGNALLASGQHAAAANVFTQVLRQNEDDDDACLGYAYCLSALQQNVEAIRVFLRLLLRQSESNPVRKWSLLNDVVPESRPIRCTNATQGFSEVVRREGMVDHLLFELKGGDSAPDSVPLSASALTFLALVVKDWGSVHEAAQLYKVALETNSGSSSNALNYVHTLEALSQYGDALSAALTFMRANAMQHVGGLTCQRVADIVDGGIEAASLRALGVLDCFDGHLDPFVFSRGRPPTAQAAAASASSSSSSSSSSSRHGEGVLVDMSDADTASTSKYPMLISGIMVDNRKNSPYSDKQLDLLALFFAVTKILFVLGRVALVKRLEEAIEPVRKGDLHITTVRNEQAYYSCVCQLAKILGTPLPVPSDAAPPIYVCGDSHSLSTAWHQIDIPAASPTRRTLVPMLVTGLKIWHLRDESVFYPKVNFERVSSQIPAGANAIFLFGEIDCREGFLVNVKRARYETIEDACRSTIDIYVNVLHEIRQRQQLRIWVHPVAAVLDETRAVVKIFNELLGERIRADPHLAWLDFFTKTLTDDGAKLRSEYQLDGSHMHPAYLKHLEAALARMWTETC